MTAPRSDHAARPYRVGPSARAPRRPPLQGRWPYAGRWPAWPYGGLDAYRVPAPPARPRPPTAAELRATAREAAARRARYAGAGLWTAELALRGALWPLGALLRVCQALVRLALRLAVPSVGAGASIGRGARTFH